MESKLNTLNKLIIEGYENLEKENAVNACKLWLDAWEGIKELKEENIESIEDFDIKYKFQEVLTNWCQDLEMELENASLENQEYFNKRIAYCTEFCQIFPKSDSFILMSMKTATAESYFEIGEKEKSEELFEKIIKEYDQSVWPYIKWGDVYWLSSIIRSNKELIDLDKAENIYQKGLSVGDEEDEYIIEERLIELREYKKQCGL